MESAARTTGRRRLGGGVNLVSSTVAYRSHVEDTPAGCHSSAPATLGFPRLPYPSRRRRPFPRESFRSASYRSAVVRSGPFARLMGNESSSADHSSRANLFSRPIAVEVTRIPPRALLHTTADPLSLSLDFHGARSTYDYRPMRRRRWWWWGSGGGGGGGGSGGGGGGWWWWWC